MTVPLKITIEQLAETINDLSLSEKKQLESLLGNKWYGTEEVNHTIDQFLEESERQHRRGEIRASEDVIRESKEKYGL